MGHPSEASGLLTQLKRQGVITLPRLVHISFQQVQSFMVFEDCLGLVLITFGTAC